MATLVPLSSALPFIIIHLPLSSFVPPFPFIHQLRLSPRHELLSPFNSCLSCATYCYSSAVPSNLHFFYLFNLSLFPHSSYLSLSLSLSLLDCFSVSISPLSDFLSVCCMSSLDPSNHSLSLFSPLFWCCFRSQCPV